MKKRLCIILFLFLFALAACDTPGADTPSPPPSQSTSAPQETASSSQAPDTGIPQPSLQGLPDFLLAFDFDRLDWLDVNENRDYRICLMEEDEKAQLSALLEMDTWTSSPMISLHSLAASSS